MCPDVYDVCMSCGRTVINTHGMPCTMSVCWPFLDVMWYSPLKRHSSLGHMYNSRQTLCSTGDSTRRICVSPYADSRMILNAPLLDMDHGSSVSPPTDHTRHNRRRQHEQTRKTAAAGRKRSPTAVCSCFRTSWAQGSRHHKPVTQPAVVRAARRRQLRVRTLERREHSP